MEDVFNIKCLRSNKVCSYCSQKCHSCGKHVPQMDIVWNATLNKFIVCHLDRPVYVLHGGACHCPERQLTHPPRSVPPHLLQHPAHIIAKQSSHAFVHTLQNTTPHRSQGYHLSPSKQKSILHLLQGRWSLCSKVALFMACNFRVLAFMCVVCENYPII